MRNSIFIFLICVFTACNTSQNSTEINSVNEISQINFKDSDSVLLDVRSAEEFREGHIANAINIDVKSDDFEAEIEKLDKSKTYFVYCKSGVRSTKACGVLQEKGFEKVVNLEDGYSNYEGK